MANVELGIRCHVHLLDVYISKLQKAHEIDCFYMQPMGDNVVNNPSKPWFSTQPCGENKLMGMVKNMFTRIGISGKTNHSLRASGATEMFRAGVPEKIIQERTGHRSLKALRLYERTTASQHQSVAKVLSAPSDVTFSSTENAKDCGGNLSLGTVIGSASHCVINVHMAAPPVLQTEKQQEEVALDL